MRKFLFSLSTSVFVMTFAAQTWGDPPLKGQQLVTLEAKIKGNANVGKVVACTFTPTATAAVRQNVSLRYDAITGNPDSPSADYALDGLIKQEVSGCKGDSGFCTKKLYSRTFDLTTSAPTITEKFVVCKPYSPTRKLCVGTLTFTWNMTLSNLEQYNLGEIQSIIQDRGILPNADFCNGTSPIPMKFIPTNGLPALIVNPGPKK